MSGASMLDLIAEQENVAQIRLTLSEVDKEKCEVLLRKLRGGAKTDIGDQPRITRVARMWKSRLSNIASLNKMLLELSAIRTSVETKDSGVTMNRIRAAFNSEHKNLGDVVEDVRETQEDAFRTAAILESLESVASEPIVESAVSDADLLRELDEYLAADDCQDISQQDRRHHRTQSTVRGSVLVPSNAY